MSKQQPTIQKFMTTQPYFIEAKETVERASGMMAQHKIRHLPVLRDGELVGIVSDRDIKLASGIQGIDPTTLPVIDVCVEHPYTVDPENLLADVAKSMASKHIGSALVVQNSKLVGIFTTVDACRALAEILETRYHP